MIEDWESLKHEFETTDITLAALAEKHRMSYSTVKSRKRRHKWMKLEDQRKAELETVTTVTVSKPVGSTISKQATKGNNKVASKTHRSAKSQKDATVEKVAKMQRKTGRPKSGGDILTEKGKLFCQYYVNNFNATQAYLRAYGSTYLTANTEGSKLLLKPCIRAEILRLKEIRAKQLFVSADDVLERYMRIAFSDLTDAVVWGTEEVKLRTEEGTEILGDDGQPLVYDQNFIKFRQSSEVDGGLICEVSLGKQGAKIKMEDRIKALDFLRDYFNMNPMDKHKIRYDMQRIALDHKRLELEEHKDDDTTNQAPPVFIDDLGSNDGEDPTNDE